MKMFWRVWRERGERLEELNRAQVELIRRILHLESVPTPSPSPETVAAAVASHLERIDCMAEGVAALAAQGEDVQADLKEYKIALAEGIERVDRSERRIKATVARARKELEARGYKDPGLDAEDYQLRLLDGVGSAEGNLQPVRDAVGADTPLRSGIPGLSGAELQAIREARNA